MSSMKTKAFIESVSPLTDSILEIILKPETYIPYKAGQYLQITTNDETLYYSIANAPLGSQKYELHIRHTDSNKSVNNLIDEFKNSGSIQITLPFGDCTLDNLNPRKDLIFIAAGTGFAPIKAIIEELLTTGAKQKYKLYWAARKKSSLYLDEKVQVWQKHAENFTYISLITDNNQMRIGDLVVANEKDKQKDMQIIISGPFDMVFDTRDILLRSGIDRNQLFSDAFSFE